MKKRLKEDRQKNLTKKRLEKGLNQEEIAQMLGISRSSYTKIELGKLDPPTTLALKIASILKTPVEELFINMKPESEVPPCPDAARSSSTSAP